MLTWCFDYVLEVLGCIRNTQDRCWSAYRLSPLSLSARRPPRGSPPATRLDGRGFSSGLSTNCQTALRPSQPNRACNLASASSHPGRGCTPGAGPDSSPELGQGLRRIPYCTIAPSDRSESTVAFTSTEGSERMRCHAQSIRRVSTLDRLSFDPRHAGQCQARLPARSVTEANRIA